MLYGEVDKIPGQKEEEPVAVLIMSFILMLRLRNCLCLNAPT
jgi:hypothetical protein